MHEALFSYFSGEMRAVSNALRRYLSFKSAACEPTFPRPSLHLLICLSDIVALKS